ncbi:stalk domain-containing protein [Paenibacillus sp. JX-17]|uniref:Stalk domain-containing protein n=1 Tax=Paenibacillus lacisoli TaxID=3064525 RepID=A0ABT9CAN4_9BACL|nr:stalk domain-containing protein [Paenibacillus sp. JX-17]MDO7906318.1 stalk domain-containing protein [Paenibacillus sp. JX-17]
MWNKKVLLIPALVSALTLAAAGAANAAVPQTTKSNVQIQTVKYVINGIENSVNTVLINNKTFISLQSLGSALGADLSSKSDGTVSIDTAEHRVALHSGSAAMTVDGTSVSLPSAVQKINGSHYVELTSFIQAIGGLVAKNTTGQLSIITFAPIGEVDQISWVAGSRLLASVTTDSGRADYLVDPDTGYHELLLVTSDASELVVAPGGDKAVYAEADGKVYQISLPSGLRSLISADTSIKNELQWSADGKSIYFLQGDKGSVIGQISTADGKVTKVLDDKVDYKENLSVSADGKKFAYTVVKTGTVTADSSKPVDQDDVSINLDGTEPQIFMFDASVKDAKPQALTTGKDDKVYVTLSPDGKSVYYVSVQDDKPAKLVAVGADGKSADVYADQDVLEAVLSQGKMVLLTAGAAGQTQVQELDLASGSKRLLGAGADSLSEVTVGSSNNIAAVNNGVVQVYAGGQWKSLTRTGE